IHREKLIREKGSGAVERGRPPKLLEFSGDNHYVVGLSIGANHISGVLTDLNTRILARQDIPTRSSRGYRALIRSVARLILDLIRTSQIQDTDVLGVGIAIGGLIDKRRNVLQYSAVFDWKEKDLARDLGELVRKPIRFDHTARVMALGELWYGIGRRIENFVCVLWGYGIGAAFILEGKPVYGTHGMAGEFGHIPVAGHSAIRCQCGNYGCLETLASGWGIANTAKACLRQKAGGLLYQLCEKNPGRVTTRLVAQAAAQGDEMCRQILGQACEYMGMGLATLINLFNPQAIILGGGIMRSENLVLDRVIQETRKYSLRNLNEEILIQPVQLGDHCKTMGAVSLILDEVLNLNILHSPSGG
ncbi:MAG TPA: ROK family protein, partial [bacterium]|nr:ROK family protein [bacterium]